MSKLVPILHGVAVALWAGGLWTVGYLVAPLLFHTLADNRALAGTLAGRMFAGQAWVGLACGGFLLLHELINFGAGALKRLVFWLVLSMLAITVIVQFWLQPFVAALRAAGAPVDALASLAMKNFAFWHGLSSMLYLLESLLALALVVKARRD